MGSEEKSADEGGRAQKSNLLTSEILKTNSSTLFVCFLLVTKTLFCSTILGEHPYIEPSTCVSDVLSCAYVRLSNAKGNTPIRNAQSGALQSRSYNVEINFGTE